MRAEYPAAVKRLQKATDQAKGYGLLENDIFDSGFSFDTELRLGTGAFVWEETALMTSIEGKRGEPRPRPPFPGSKRTLAETDSSEQCGNICRYTFYTE